MTEAPPDLIHLRDFLVTAEVGAFASEHGTTQRMRFSLQAELTRPGTGAGDDVDRVLSYDVLVAAVTDSLAQRRFDLLEALAEDIAARVLAHGGVASIRVTIEKLDRVPGALGVTITRRAGMRAETGAGAEKVAGRGRKAAHPVMPVLRAGADLPPGGAILVPDAPGLPLPEAGDPVQLGLLALDQGAWALAARLGVAVAATRTELQAAAATGTTVVWAPARMVREAADLSGADRLDPAALGQWLGRRLSGTTS